MGIDERRRHGVHEGLREALGPQRAADLMEMLPPAGWGDVAMKKDLDSLALSWHRDLESHQLENKKDFEILEHKLRGEIHRVARNQLFAFATIVGVLNTGMVALLRTS